MSRSIDDKDTGDLYLPAALTEDRFAYLLDRLEREEASPYMLGLKRANIAQPDISPGSLRATTVPRILSSSVVLPWST